MIKAVIFAVNAAMAMLYLAVIGLIALGVWGRL